MPGALPEPRDARGFPAHHFDAALTVVVEKDDSLQGLWTQIMAGREVGPFDPCRDIEGFDDLLFVGLAFEPSTYGET
jgi:hypothetical protein